MDEITNHNKNNTEHTTKHEHVNNYQGKTQYLSVTHKRT
jgi:hypothetical protein